MRSGSAHGEGGGDGAARGRQRRGRGGDGAGVGIKECPRREIWHRGATQSARWRRRATKALAQEAAPTDGERAAGWGGVSKGFPRFIRRAAFFF